MKLTKILTVLLLVSLLFAMLMIGASAAYSETVPVDPEEDPTYSTTTDMLWQIKPETAKALLVILAAIFALALPIAPITVFLIKLIKNRKAFEVVDYIILGISALWLMSGVLIFILIL